VVHSPDEALIFQLSAQICGVLSLAYHETQQKWNGFHFGQSWFNLPY
jgi:hypothetical protein